MDILLVIVVGVASSFLASTLFLYTLFRLKPQIEISPYIAREEGQNAPLYTFKFVNRSRRSIVNVHIEATITKPSDVDGGPILWTREIPLLKSFIFGVGGYNRKDPIADYAIRISTTEDLDDLWKSDNDYIGLRIIATDSLSGFSASFLQAFRIKRNSIQPGSHKYGLDLDVS